MRVVGVRGAQQGSSEVAGEVRIVMCPRDDLPRSPGTGHTVLLRWTDNLILRGFALVQQSAADTGY